MRKDSGLIKINKYLANSGVASRSQIDKLIRAKQVLVNGVVAEQGLKVDPSSDEIKVLGEKIAKNANLAYIVINKPLWVVSTTSDEMGRATVVDLVDLGVRVYPVGRLDSDSTGLVLLTNDGELTHRLTHPKFHIPKVYEVTVKEKVKNIHLKLLREGVELKDGKTAPAEVEIIEEDKDLTRLRFVLHEGRNRQIRRMCGKLGLEVTALKRVEIGPIMLGNLKEGEYRCLSEKETKNLKEVVNLK